MHQELRGRLVSETSLPVAWGVSAHDVPAPRVVLYQISGLTDYTSSGASGYAQARVQADCFGASYGVAQGAAQSVLLALSGWRGETIEAVFHDGSRDTQPDAGEMLFRVSLDFIVHFQSET